MRGDRPTDNYGLWGRVKFTPHARGSTVGIYLVPNSLLVYPACAGIDLRQWFLDLFDKGLPRMRGDRPIPALSVHPAAAFTPHARGSTQAPSPHSHPPGVYPACAGIDPCLDIRFMVHQRLPRMRGDRPDADNRTESEASFTPHARGSTHIRGCCGRVDAVYPACAGIDLVFSQFFQGFRSLPRMRGDRPYTQINRIGGCTFTPHARGSTPREK